jgi:nucleoid DNA-binding protein
MDIRVYIARLLEEHDCVILPGFGGFIGNYAPARIDPVSHSFVPPAKKILFNINLKQNDGLLCNRIATDEGVSYSEALVLVNEMIETIRHELKTGKPSALPEVGRLFSGKEGTLQFEQEKNSNLLPDAFGLTTFISPPVIRNSHSYRIERVLVQQQKETGRKRKLDAGPLKWAAMLALPIGAAAILGITQYGKLKTPAVSNAGILSAVFSRYSASSLVEKKAAPSGSPEASIDFGFTPSVFEVRSTANNVNSSADIDMDKLLRTAESASGSASRGSGDKLDDNLGQIDAAQTAHNKSTEPVSDNSQPSVATDFKTSDRFAIIIGAFKIRENAGKCIQEARCKGLNAGIFDQSKNGLYRVALSTANKQNEAEDLLSKAREAGFTGAWLLTK